MATRTLYVLSGEEKQGAHASALQHKDEEGCEAAGSGSPGLDMGGWSCNSLIKTWELGRLQSGPGAES